MVLQHGHLCMNKHKGIAFGKTKEAMADETRGSTYTTWIMIQMDLT